MVNGSHCGDSRHLLIVFQYFSVTISFRKRRKNFFYAKMGRSFLGLHVEDMMFDSLQTVIDSFLEMKCRRLVTEICRNV